MIELKLKNEFLKLLEKIINEIKCNSIKIYLNYNIKTKAFEGKGESYLKLSGTKKKTSIKNLDENITTLISEFKII